MPPKRKQPAAPKPPSKRRSALAKEHDITADQEAEIKDAFALFARDDGEAISQTDVRRCLIALDAPPRDNDTFNELLDAAAADEEGWISYSNFVGIAALAMGMRENDNDEEADAEIAKAYSLFTKGQERPITLQDLRRVAGEIREDVPENVLRDMVREATGGGLGGIGMEEFEGVMRRAGVFS